MASAQVSSPELEGDVKVEEEVHDEELARESEVEKPDATKPASEDKEDPFEAEDEGGHEETTEVLTYAGARSIDDDNDDDLVAEGEGAGDGD
ncbi:hypothetical protein MLD38_036791 [Melastoma candidum]|uniref:Uncharacterized protein n=1 Tax=Melastoma candidum TaxID=119954 RepID=A0ACB9LK34_9MYRT|nr:hypothetical protein MLD38_036791 [Melastoma candidum]